MRTTYQLLYLYYAGSWQNNGLSGTFLYIFQDSLLLFCLMLKCKYVQERKVMDLKRHIYVVFKTHFDIGFTDLARKVTERYSGKMLDDVIATCEGTKHLGKDRKYVWTMPSWPLTQSIRNTSQYKQEKAYRLISDRQITWHLLPFTTHTEFCGMEEFIRGFRFSTSLSMEFGFWPVSAKMTDVPGHTWILPTLLSGAGVKFLHLGCNAGSMPPDVPMLFWWEGPDGSRVLTFYSKGGYGSSPVPPESWRYPAWMALIQTSDNAGPQPPEIVTSLENEIMGRLPDAKVHVGTMDDFYNHIIESNLDIPVIKKDLSDSWIHGVGSYPGEVSKIRRSRRHLIDAEKLMAFLKAKGLYDNIYSSMISDAFENSLLFGEHTWGLDVKTTMGYDRHYEKKSFLKHKNDTSYTRMEDSWDEQRERAHKAFNYSLDTRNKLMDMLVQNIDYPSTRMVVFNQLGYIRDAWVDIPETFQSSGLMDIRDSSTLALCRTGDTLKAYVRNMPPFGYTTLIPGPAQYNEYNSSIIDDEGYAALENSYYIIKVDKKTGCIASLYDKTCEKDWVNPLFNEGFASYRYDIYGDEDITGFIRSYSYRFYDWLVNDLGRMSYPSISHMTFRPICEGVKVEYDSYGSYISIHMSACNISHNEYGNAETVNIKVMLPHDENRIDFKFTINNKQETPYVEAGHFVFPLNISCPQYAINKLGSVINPKTDIIEGANNILYCLEDWVDVSDGSHGLCFISYDTPLFSIGNEGIYKYRKKYEEGLPVLYFNAFNNCWGTNFPQWMGGNYSFSFSIFSHNGDWKDGNVPERCMGILNPPVIGFSDAGSGNLPLWDSLFSIKGAAVSAFKPADNEKDTYILRLREINGKEGTVEISNCTLAENALFCDLQERAISNPIPIANGSLSLKIKPFEIITIKLK